MRPESWLWHSGSAGARLARGALWGPSAAYGLMTRWRARAYRAGLLPTRRVERPVVAVGNLTVGGTGKTPLASWIASFYAARGLRPAVVLRGYGRDEGDLHRKATPAALVIEDPNRFRAARQAIDGGAQVIVLDDAFQRLDLHRDLNIAVIAAESLDTLPRLLPAGPWREAWAALRRADCAVITRRDATQSAARAAALRVTRSVGVHPVAIAIAHLEISHFVGLRSGEALPRAAIWGRPVLATCGIGVPDSFALQLRALGAEVRLRAWRDHHAYRPEDLRALLSAAGSVDYVVVTGKDAVKLRRLWPAAYPEPLVAELTLHWEAGGDLMASALSNAVANTSNQTGGSLT